MGHIQSFTELLAFLIRRRVLIASIVIVGALLSVLFAKAQPVSYESIAVIQVQTPMVRDPSAATAPPQTGSAQLLQAIEQRLTTRENMIATIDRHGLFADASGLTLDQKVGLLRRSVRFESVASVANQPYGGATQISAILIYARLGEADLAARVANDFAQGILDMGSAGQMDRARETLAFFQEEETRVAAELAAIEADLADYRNANANALPAMVDAQRTELVSLDADLRALSQSLLALEGERSVIGAGDAVRATDRRAIADLDARQAVIDAQRAALAARRSEIELALAATPEVERALGAFDRRLQQGQDQYAVVTRQLAEAETALRLAERQQTERFALLERAITPEFPAGSGRRKVAAAGTMASVLLALAVAFAVEWLRPVVRTAAQMERELNLRPVVSIPELPSRRPVPNGGGRLRLIDDPHRPILGLPRYAVIAGGATLFLLAAAAIS